MKRKLPPPRSCKLVTSVVALTTFPLWSTSIPWCSARPIAFSISPRAIPPVRPRSTTSAVLLLSASLRASPPPATTVCKSSGQSFSQSQRAGGSYLTFGYTYSHTIDSASGFDSRNPAVPAYSPNQFRASSDSDLRHYLVSSGTWTLPLHYYFAALPARLTDGWSIAGLFSWRTGFPLDVFANLPTVYSFTSPGPSGAGDPGLVRANLVAPYQAVDPRSNSTFRGVLGNFWFSPDSFSNARCPSKGSVDGSKRVRSRHHYASQRFASSCQSCVAHLRHSASQFLSRAGPVQP